MRRGISFACLFVCLVVSLGSSIPLRAQEATPELPSVVLLDPAGSVFASTTTLQAAADGLYALEEAYVPLRVGDEDGLLEKAGGIGYRLARLALLDLPLAQLHVVVRHEVAGHGGRIRQLGGDVQRYEIDLPLPYGDGDGAVSYEIRVLGRYLVAGERVLRAGVRLGDGPWGGFDGLELEGRRLHTGPRLTLGGRLGLWRQFDLPAGSTDRNVGGMALARATVAVGALPFSPVVELGGKTEGYVPGEALSGGLIARIGGAFSF